MPHFLCTTCGTQYPDSEKPPQSCVICAEERQYVGWQGQRWTTLDQVRAEHQARVEPEGSGLTGIGSRPDFAIAQRALHLATASGGFVWDCAALIDDTVVEALRKRGGVRAMAISHPHYYTTMVDWSRALGGVPIYLNALDRPWVVRHDPAIVYWDGPVLELVPGVTLIHCGGHFAGSTVLHWAAGADGLGALLTGDTIMVNMDRRTVSFMYSYPNLIPLSAEAVERIVAAVDPFEFEQIYGGWFGKNVREGGKAALVYSARRYLRAIGPRGWSSG